MTFTNSPASFMLFTSEVNFYIVAIFLAFFGFHTVSIRTVPINVLNGIAIFVDYFPATNSTDGSFNKVSGHRR